MDKALLRATDLSVGVQTADGLFTAVDRVSFALGRGEILGIVGESGCGKSLTALSVAGLLRPPVAVTGGSIRFGDTELTRLSALEKSRLQGKDIAMVYQEPMTSLNPLMPVGKQVAEPLRLHTDMGRADIRRGVLAVLDKVGLKEPEALLRAYPHELSGGMRQRVVIAMAIICKPALLIADEPTTALDVTLQAQILALLKSVGREYGMSLLFISHDLGVVRLLCDRVAVMYAGRFVEQGDTRAVFEHPAHPYTRGLLGSIPARDRRGQPLAAIPGRVPTITDVREACPFAPRCPIAVDSCHTQEPPDVPLGAGHSARCIFADREGASHAGR